MKRHMATSIAGLLALSDYELQKVAPYCTVDGKRLQTVDQVRQALHEAKSTGMEVIPSPECDNYDKWGYCKGHD